MKDYGRADALACPFDKTSAIVAVKTRLKRLDGLTQERLINCGYAICDAAMRKWVDSGLLAPAAFPYQSSGVG